MTWTLTIALAQAMIGFGPEPLRPINPFILIPGLGGSSLEVTLDGAKFPCPSKAPSKKIVDSRKLLPDSILFPENPMEMLCFISEFTLAFDPETKRWSQHQGINVDVINFGAMNGDSAGISEQYRILEEYGYKENETMFTAPYDWRFPDYQLDRYFKRLMDLVVHAFDLNNGRKVSLISQSNGPQVALAFLNWDGLTQEWKDKYIAWNVATNGVFGGSAGGMLYLVTMPGAIRQVQFQIASAFNLAPVAGDNAYTFDHSPIIVTPTKSYSAFDIAELLEDMGQGSMAPRYESIRKLGVLANLGAPGVNTFVVAGTNIVTPTTYYFDAENPINSATAPVPYRQETTRVGDGIVPLASQLRSLTWRDAPNMAGKQMYTRVLMNVSHLPGVDEGCLPDYPSSEDYGACMRTPPYVPSPGQIAGAPDGKGGTLGYHYCETDADCNAGIWTAGFCLPKFKYCGARGTYNSDKAFSEIAELLAYGSLPAGGPTDSNSAALIKKYIGGQ